MRYLSLLILMIPLSVMGFIGDDSLIEFNDSLQFELFLRDLHQNAALKADSNLVLSAQALNEHNMQYPVLFGELVRQHVQSGIYAREFDRVNKDLNFWLRKVGGPSSESYLAQAIYAVSFRINSSFTDEQLAEMQRLRERFNAAEQTPQPYFNLIHTTLDRALIQAQINNRRYDIAVEVSIEILSLDLPAMYRESAFYDHFRVGSFYYHMGDLDSSEEFFNMTIAEVGEIENAPEREIFAKAFHYIGIIARDRGDTSKWVSHTLQAIELLEQNNSHALASPLLDMADFYFSRGLEEEALKYVVRAENSPYARDGYPGYREANILMYYARFYESKGEYDQAIELCLKALDVDDLNRILTQVYPMLPELYAKKGDYEKAYESAMQFHLQYRDMVNAQSIRSVERSRRLYELRKKEMEAEAEKAKLQAEIEQEQEAKRFQGTILVLAIAIILLLTLLVVRMLVARKRLRRMNVLLSKQTDELRAARDEADRALKVKSEFLSVMSHEIRTPLNGIIGMNRELLRKDPREDQKSQLELVASASGHLLKLLNDILDSNKINSGKIELDEQLIPLDQLLNDVEEIARAMAGGSGLKFSMKKASGLPKLVMLDELRVKQILSNLVSNAVKFTEEGSIIINAALVEEKWLEFRVSDTGIGIPKEKHQSIFEEYTQASVSTTRQFGGSGLGLSISKRLTTLMNGNIQLESVEGEGSTFIVRIPAKGVEFGASELVESDFDDGELDGSKFLVAEDNELNQAVIGALLTRWGVAYDFALNGKEAVEMAAEGDYNLVLMDIQMPLMDGMEATKLIRQSEHPGVAALPIIALTASAQPEEIEAMKAAGMDEHVLKPIDTSKLVSAIRNNLN